jgi:hypothetical protein
MSKKMSITTTEQKAILIFVVAAFLWAMLFVPTYGPAIEKLDPILGYLVFNAVFFVGITIAAWSITKYIHNRQFSVAKFATTALLSFFGMTFLWNVFTGSLVLMPNNTYKLAFLSVSQADFLLAHIGELAFPFLKTTFVAIPMAGQVGGLFIWTYLVAPVAIAIIIAELKPTRQFLAVFNGFSGGKKK